MTEGRLVDHRYLLGRRLGAGAFGVVHRAEQKVLGISLREVAVKLFAVERLRLPPRQLLRDALQMVAVVEAALDPEVRRRFVSLLDAGLDAAAGWQPFVVMELVPTTLHRRIGGLPLPVETMLRYARELVAGVAFLHRSGFVHRDLKPDNVLLTADDQVKLADLGLAVATEELLAGEPPAGALAYQPPEALSLHRTTEAADVYAAGLICYEMLTGDLPFPVELAVPERRAELIKAKLEPPTPPSRAANLELREHPELEQVVLTALAPPSERYPDGPALLAALDAVSAGAAPPPVEPARRFPVPQGPAALLERAMAALGDGDPDGAAGLAEEAVHRNGQQPDETRSAQVYLAAVDLLARADRLPTARRVAAAALRWRRCRVTLEAMALAHQGTALGDRYAQWAREAQPC